MRGRVESVIALHLRDSITVLKKVVGTLVFEPLFILQKKRLVLMLEICSILHNIVNYGIIDINYNYFRYKANNTGS